VQSDLSKLNQSYETTAVARTGQGLHYFVLPKRSIESGQIPTIEEVTELAGIKLSGEIEVNASTLAYALSALMSDKVMSSSDPPPALQTPEERLKAAFISASADANFRVAQQAAYERIVPFDSSPLGAVSLAEIATSLITGGGAVYVGTKLGIATIAGAAAGPVLILTGAAVGIVIVCGAKAAGETIGKGVGKAFLNLLGLSG
jgi:hypothetical protein